MSNQAPMWKTLLVVAVMVVGVLYALPNLYGEDPALQINSVREEDAAKLSADRINRHLQEAGLAAQNIEQNASGVLVRFADESIQLQAKDLLTGALGNGYTVALNLAPATPGWLKAINALPMYLGLDLRGGVHFLMEVDMEAANKQAYERYVSDFRNLLREEKIRYLTIERDARDGKDGVFVKLRSAEDRESASQLIRKTYPELVLVDLEQEGSPYIFASLTEASIREVQTMAVQQNITTLHNRVNELGVAEPVVQRQGENRIVVQLPGIQDTARAKEILGATATLEFRMVDEKGNSQEAAASGRVPPGSKLYFERGGAPVLLQNRVMLTGEYIVDASSGMEQDTGSPAVFITLDGKGASLFTQATKDNVGKLMAVVFIETKTESRVVDGQTVKTKRKVEEVINTARIREQLGKRFQISGLDSPAEARDLALLLRAGALAAPVDIVEERTVGPSLGKDNIEKGLWSCIIGFIFVIAFMIWRYKLFGVFSSLALFANLVLLVALLSMLQATLTLPGIAGIVLTVGMAVDANVLINERIREELRNGSTPLASIEAGYERAFGTIADSNLTTLIAGVFLFALGSGPVKGFAVVLCLGILTSMFTALTGARVLVALVYGRKSRVARLSI
ncbi:MAG: protein translocase subunit SecD [Pseudomonadota bacterium]